MVTESGKTSGCADEDGLCAARLTRALFRCRPPALLPVTTGQRRGGGGGGGGGGQGGGAGETVQWRQQGDLHPAQQGAPAARTRPLRGVTPPHPRLAPDQPGHPGVGAGARGGVSPHHAPQPPHHARLQAPGGRGRGRGPRGDDGDRDLARRQLPHPRPAQAARPQGDRGGLPDREARAQAEDQDRVRPGQPADEHAGDPGEHPADHGQVHLHHHQRAQQHGRHRPAAQHCRQPALIPYIRE